MNSFKTIILLSVIFFAGTSAFAQQHQHSEHLTTLLEHYFDVKEALAEDDFEKALSSSSDLRDEVIRNDEMNNHEKHFQMHVEHHGSMVEAVTNGVEAGDIDELRSFFKNISSNLIKALKNQDFDEEMLYLQYCPMADNGKGAQWISDQEKIINPYMGSKMSGCGKTKATIGLDH